ncbi:MAG TPA: GTPase HflX [Firmicutes bacterium]|nr:GTPase HflX [Bacillota bacterium]
MIENQKTPQKAVLVAVDLGEYDVDISLDELAELAATAGAEVTGRVVQKRESYDSATCIGHGRLAEIELFCHNTESDLLIFDCELTATQLRNIEEITGVRVIDRTMLILDIFAMRARTREGRLQVELAQQKYLLPRLAGLGTALSRLGGGIGTRGPGETKLESDRRHIRRRIRALEQQLEELKKRRMNVHNRRQKDNATVVAIVGYTNAGKSTLLNRLTGSNIYAENRLFATLDPTARSLTLPGGEDIILIDTVGFIRRLPHHLVEAFQSTLEEAMYADLLLNVCDVTDSDVDEKIKVTTSLLEQLGAGDKPLITVLNKCDLAGRAPFCINDKTVAISAATGEGIDRLLVSVEKYIPKKYVNVTLKIPYAESQLLGQVRMHGKVFSENYAEDGILLQGNLEIAYLSKVRDYVISHGIEH